MQKRASIEIIKVTNNCCILLKEEASLEHIAKMILLVCGRRYICIIASCILVRPRFSLGALAVELRALKDLARQPYGSGTTGGFSCLPLCHMFLHGAP